MNHITARVIDDALLRQKAAAPETECANRVGKGKPERHEDHPSREIHATEETTGHDDKSNSGKDKLEIHHCRHRVIWSYFRSRDQGLPEFPVHRYDRTRSADEGSFTPLFAKAH